MTPHRQLVEHDPDKGQYGDCMRTSLACVMDLEPEVVPHFFAEGPDDHHMGMIKLNSWLAAQGLRRVIIAFPGDITKEAVFNFMDQTNPLVMWFLVGKSSHPSGCNHVVVCQGGRQIHNTSDSEIIGPVEDDNMWIIEFLTPDFQGDWK